MPKMLSNLDLVRNQLLNAAIHNSNGAPPSPVVGQVYYDTGTGLFGVYTSSGWMYLTAATGANVSQAGNSAAAGIMKVSAGTNTNVTDYSGGVGLLKSSSSGVVSPAVAGTDYLAPTGSGASLTGLTQSQISGLTAALAALAPLASPTFTGHVTVPAPTNSTDATTKAYVDATAQGLNAKPSATVLASVQTTLSGLLTVDGVTLTAGQRVLAVGQTTTTQNGLWVAASGAWTRPTDYATGSSQLGAYVFIEGGTTNASSGWVQTGTTAITVDTNASAWVQFSGAAEITAGAGLAKSGNTLSIENSGVLTIAHGGTGAASASAAKGTLGFAGVFNSAAIGDGTSTTLTVTHSLNNAIPHVQVYDVTGANPALVMCDVATTSANVVTLTFGTAPATGGIKCVVIG